MVGCFLASDLHLYLTEEKLELRLETTCHLKAESSTQVKGRMEVSESKMGQQDHRFTLAGFGDCNLSVMLLVHDKK